ncbi:MAG: hypothetical protein UD961_09625 [Bacteroidales bacterium]|nr:hypothetical protein [Bacteroidales bacterium]
MKRIITLLALIAIASAAHAQTDSLVVFDTQGDKLGISIAGFNIALGENDKEEYTDEYIYHEPRKNAVTANLLGFSYGGTALTAMPYYGPWEGEGDFLDIYAGRFDLEGASWTVSLDKRGIFYYRIGVLASFDIYSFNNNVTLYNNESGDLMPRPLEGNVKKSRLRTTYCGVNMGLGFKIHKVMLMVSGTAEILGNASVKYKNPGKTVYQIKGLNPIRSRISLSSTWDGFGLYVDYSLTPVFKPGTGNDAHTLSFGCKFGF